MKHAVSGKKLPQASGPTAVSYAAHMLLVYMSVYVCVTMLQHDMCDPVVCLHRRVRLVLCLALLLSHGALLELHMIESVVRLLLGQLILVIVPHAISVIH